MVEKVQHELLETPVTVYNFEVEDYHTYYVSASAESDDSFVLVHNRCGESFNEQQQAVIDLAQENRHGLSTSDANTLVEWANEYGVNNHEIMVHTNRSGIWSEIYHIKIHGYHIPVID